MLYFQSNLYFANNWNRQTGRQVDRQTYVLGGMRLQNLFCLCAQKRKNDGLKNKDVLVNADDLRNVDNLWVELKIT